MFRIENLLKIDLHCHLDGSLDFRFLREVSGVDDLEELRRHVQVNGKHCQSLAQYLEKFDLPVKCLQTEENIRRAAESFMDTLVPDNIMYAEVRFAPNLHTLYGLPLDSILDSVLAGLHTGEKKHDIKTNVILCAMRHHAMKDNQEVFRLAKKYLGKGVCAVDLAGDEAAYPTKDFQELFAYAVDNGIPFTIHAGECGDAENIRDAVLMGARRIGHGIAMRGNDELQRLCAEREIGIEMCPISNFQTKAVAATGEYPIREFMEHGLCVTVNTDNRTVSATTIMKEFKFLQQQYDFNESEIITLMRNAIRCSFTSENTKKDLMERLCTSIGG